MESATVTKKNAKYMVRLDHIIRIMGRDGLKEGAMGDREWVSAPDMPWTGPAD